MIWTYITHHGFKVKYKLHGSWNTNPIDQWSVGCCSGRLPGTSSKDHLSKKNRQTLRGEWKGEAGADPEKKMGGGVQSLHTCCKMKGIHLKNVEH